MQVVKAPQPYNINYHIIVFLAGSIEMGKAELWQDLVADQLQAYDGVLLNPRRDDWDSSWKQTIDNPQFNEQVNWELDGLDRADIVFMHFDTDTMSPITLLELGYLANTKPVIISCGKRFWKRGNIEVLCSRCSNLYLYESLGCAIDQLKLRCYADI